MANNINRLSPNNLSKLPVGMHTDGRGLTLIVKTIDHVLNNGEIKTYTSRSWTYIYRTSFREAAGTIKQRIHKIGIGPLSRISLKQARQLTDELNYIRASGRDPATERRQRRLEQQRATTQGMTFEQAARARIRAKTIEWKDGGKSEKQWTHSLETYVFPHIGFLDPATIEVSDVVKVLEPIWQDKTETARRVMQRMGDIFGWCITMNHRQSPNPSIWKGCLANVLPSPSKFQVVKSHGYIPHEKMYSLTSELQKSNTVAHLCALFILWTATRSSEARLAQWHEIDLNNALWEIPAQRMKAGKKHLVPLQPELVTLLLEMPRFTDCEWVFPNIAGTNAINDVTVSKLFKDAGFPTSTIHGCRASFKSWSFDYERNQQATEFQLAHNLPDETEAAYVRTTLIDIRRRLMQEWLTYTLTNKNAPGATVTSIVKQRRKSS